MIEVNGWMNMCLRLLPGLHYGPAMTNILANRQRGALAITHCTAPQGQSERKEWIICWSGHFLSLPLSCCAHICVCMCVNIGREVSMCTSVAEGRERKRINDCNKWRWTFQALCSLPVFFSIFLSPTAKYVLISMHIYNLCWTSGSPVFSEVIGLLRGAESTISNTQRISNPSSKLWWYKAFISNSSLFGHCVSWVWWKVG